MCPSSEIKKCCSLLNILRIVYIVDKAEHGMMSAVKTVGQVFLFLTIFPMWNDRVYITCVRLRVQLNVNKFDIKRNVKGVEARIIFCIR